MPAEVSTWLPKVGSAQFAFESVRSMMTSPPSRTLPSENAHLGFPRKVSPSLRVPFRSVSPSQATSQNPKSRYLKRRWNSPPARSKGTPKASPSSFWRKEKLLKTGIWSTGDGSEFDHESRTVFSPRRQSRRRKDEGRNGENAIKFITFVPCYSKPSRLLFGFFVINFYCLLIDWKTQK